MILVEHVDLTIILSDASVVAMAYAEKVKIDVIAPLIVGDIKAIKILYMHLGKF